MAATLSMSTPFDTPTRSRSHQGVTLPTLSPSESPQTIQRPTSQVSLHLPAQIPLQSPTPGYDQPQQPFTAHSQSYPYMQYKSYPSAAGSAGLAVPGSAAYFSAYPPTGTSVVFNQHLPTQMYDPRASTPLMRTVSHAHPLTSANDLTASSRYSSSPHSPSAQVLDGPASASVPAYQWQLHAPSLAIGQTDDGHAHAPLHSHINPSVINTTTNPSHPMSRSTSGASDVGDVQRLLTPHIEARDQCSPNIAAADLRKVSDSLGGYTSRGYIGPGSTAAYTDRYAPGLTPAPMTASYPQPSAGQYWGRETSADPNSGYLPFSAHREKYPEQGYVQQQQQQQQQLQMVPENEYERERMVTVSENKKLLETLGLGGGAQPMRPSRQASSSNLRARKPSHKKRVANYDQHVRSSPRIASQHRTVSYMNLDAGESEMSDESYSSEAIYEEEDYRPVKRGRGHKQAMGRKASSYDRPRKYLDLSLWGLLQVYPEIPKLFPLFYYTLNNDLSINSDSVPLIGSIPSTVTPMEKSNILRSYYHRGRRVLGQLDSFTGRCDRKYEGPEERWPELEHNTRIAVRDVRRKIVERCENYKYTRRDILDKNVGKHKWQAIDAGLIEWRLGQTSGDPAGDLANVTLTLPTPPPGVLAQQQHEQQLQHAAQQQQQQQMHLAPDYHTQRVIRPMPSRNRLVSTAPRSISVNMTDMSGSVPTPVPTYPGTAYSLPYSAATQQQYHASSPAPPTMMYATSASTSTAPISVGVGVPITPAIITSAGSPGMDPRLTSGGHTPVPFTQQSSPPIGTAGLEVVHPEGIVTASSGLSSAPPVWHGAMAVGKVEVELKREQSVESGDESD